MADSPKLLPTLHVNTFTDLSSLSGIIGQKAVTYDTMIEFVYDGTNWIDTPLRKLSVKSGTPTVTLSTAFGTGSTVSISGNNVAGTVTVNTGTALGAGSNLFTIKLADNTTFPTMTIIMAAPSDSTTVGSITGVFQAAGTTSAGTIAAKGVSLSINTTYTFSYHILGY